MKADIQTCNLNIESHSARIHELEKKTMSLYAERDQLNDIIRRHVSNNRTLQDTIRRNVVESRKLSKELHDVKSKLEVINCMLLLINNVLMIVK